MIETALKGGFGIATALTLPAFEAQLKGLPKQFHSVIFNTTLRCHHLLVETLDMI
jgi:hypothetical protein